MTTVLQWPEGRNDQITVARQAAQVIREGGLVIYPTDTVYGVGCDPFNEGAVRRIYEVKGRPDEKAIIWLVESLDDARAWVEVDERAETLATQFWPGGLSLVLRRREPGEGQLPTLGVRSPGHKAALTIIRAAGGRVATTSANRSGEPSARSADEALSTIGGLVDLVVDAGPATVGVESTVVDLSGEEAALLRDGAIDIDELEAALGGKLRAS